MLTETRSAFVIWIAQINLEDAKSQVLGATTIPAVMRRDEVGDMAEAVQVFKDNGLKLRASEQEAKAISLSLA